MTYTQLFDVEKIAAIGYNDCKLGASCLPAMVQIIDIAILLGSKYSSCVYNCFLQEIYFSTLVLAGGTPGMAVATVPGAPQSGYLNGVLFLNGNAFDSSACKSGFFHPISVFQKLRTRSTGAKFVSTTTGRPLSRYPAKNTANITLVILVWRRAFHSSSTTIPAERMHGVHRRQAGGL